MEAPIAEIKPDIKKAFISNIFRVAVIIALIIGTLIYLNVIVGLDVFLDTFALFGINISTSTVVFWFILITILATTILLILNYVNLGKLTYTLYPDKLTYGKSFFIMQTSSKSIPYVNIAKITYEDKSFLNTSKITIELTGMKEPKLELDFIDNAAEVVRKIQELIQNYKANYYAQYSQKNKYQNIVDKY